MERDAWTDDKQLLDWHRICFQETEQLETKADVLRRKLAYLFVASSFKNTNGLPLHHSMELKRLHKKYVECMDNKNGINNFAESVQSLVSGRPSESGEWKSGLSKDSLQRFTTLKGKKQQLDFSTLRLEKKQPTELLGQKPLETIQPLPSSKLPTTPFVPTPVLPLSSTQNSFRVPSSHQQPIHCGMPSSVCTSVPQETVSSGQPSTQVPLYATRAHHQTVNNETQWQMRPNAQNARVSTYDGDRQGKGKGFKYANKYSKRKRQRGGSLEDEEDDDCIAEDSAQKKSNAFITARDQFHINQKNSGPGGGGTSGHGPSGGSYNNYDQSSVGNYGVSKRSLGARRGPAGKFVPPVKRDQEDEAHDEIRSRVLYGGASNSSKNLPPELEGDERLKNIEPKMVELITNEIMDHGSPVQWEDIAGLDFAKSSIKEIVVWPMLRPDIFTGLRGPPRGLLLFGPPGTGKTLIGKCVASQVRATFFSISASSLTSKWVGEGEKMVRALFAVARCYQPAVIFIDEIDSLLSQRSDNEHEASRRIKTEFLVQLDGATTSSEDHILVIGATNRPQEIDEAARRRLVKRLYIPLPDMSARKQIILNLLKEQKHSLDTSDLDKLCTETDGYSGADMANLCRDAAYWPLRSITDIANISADQVRPITFDDFTKSLATIRPSVSSKDLDIYIEWNKTYGSGK